MWYNVTYMAVDRCAFNTSLLRICEIKGCRFARVDSGDTGFSERIRETIYHVRHAGPKKMAGSTTKSIALNPYRFRPNGEPCLLGKDKIPENNGQREYFENATESGMDSEGNPLF